MKKNPLITVGIPTYNRSKGLQHTLECITKQTYSNLEIIISDNGSTDKAVESIGKKFSRDDKRVKYVKHETNRGPIFNFNYVLEQAQGQYFMWAADDDQWDVTFIEKLLTKIITTGCKIAFCNINQIDPQHNHIGMFRYDQNFSSNDIYLRIKTFIFMKDVVLGKGSMIYSLMDKNLIKKTISNASYWNKFGYGSDNVVVLQLLFQSPMAIVDEFLYSVTTFNEKHYDYHKTDINSDTNLKTETFIEKLKSNFTRLIDRHNYFTECKKIINESSLSFSEKKILTCKLVLRELWFIKKDFYIFIRYFKRKIF